MSAGQLRTLGKETVVYGLSTVVARLLNFLLLPFYTYYLVPAELGVVATVFAYIAFLNILFQYGMDQAYLRYAAGAGKQEADRTFSTAFWSLAATSLSFSAFLLLAARPLAAWGGIGAESAYLVRYAACVLALDALSIVPFAELRLRHKAWSYVGIKSLNIVVNVGANIAFLAGLGLGVRGVFLAAIVASAASLSLLGLIAVPRLFAGFDGARYRELLRFGLPFVPAGLGAMMVQVIDRPILLHLTDEATVGIYQANYRLGIFMLLVVSMFDQAWRPFFLERAGRPGADELIGKVLSYFLAGSVWIVLGLSLFIGDIVRFPLGGITLIEKSYWSGLSIVPVVLSAYIFHGAYINFIATVTLAKRTDLLVWITFLGAAVNVAVNLALIPSMGMMGAAWATFASYAAMAVSLHFVGRRVYPIPYEWPRILKLACAAAAAGGGLFGLHQTFPAGGPWFLSRAGVLIFFPMLLLALRFFSKGELTALFSRS